MRLKTKMKVHVGAVVLLATACITFAAFAAYPSVAHVRLPGSARKVLRELLGDSVSAANAPLAGADGTGNGYHGRDSVEVKEACEEIYGLLPCSSSVAGSTFLMAAYGYLVLVAAQLISDGSELLLQVLDPGLIGGLLLPVLGALPDTLLILVSGLGGTKEEAQEQVLVGMGVLAGSTIMILTVAWGGSLICGRCDLIEKPTRRDSSSAGAPGRPGSAGAGAGAAGGGVGGSFVLVAKDRTLTRPYNWYRTGVTTDEQTRIGAWIMMGSVVPFIIMQIPLMDGASGEYYEQQSRIAALLGLLLSFAGLVAYCAYQVLSPWLQASKIQYARVHYLRTMAIRDLHHLALKNTWGGLVRPDGSPDRDTLHKVFRHFDEDGSGSLSRSEIKGLILGLGIQNQGDVPPEAQIHEWMRDFDSNSDGEIGEEEFVHGMERWMAQFGGGPGGAGKHRRRQSSTNLESILDGHVDTAKVHLEGLEDSLLDEQEGDDDDDDEDEEAPKTPAEIYRQAIIKIVGGALLVTVFADPVVDSITSFSKASHIPAFFVAFVVTPLASNASELISCLIFAMKRRKRTISLTYSQVYGAISMNNTMCLGTFLALVYFRSLNWQFSAEVTIILLNTFIIGILGGTRRTFQTWLAFPVLALYPLSILIVAFLDYVLGWN
ncbi:unnamed protein product [Closterium sp. Yama58-4]|nr:unnamed protein product [Closterium sp. Yama58-4]